MKKPLFAIALAAAAFTAGEYESQRRVKKYMTTEGRDMLSQAVDVAWTEGHDVGWNKALKSKTAVRWAACKLFDIDPATGEKPE